MLIKSVGVSVQETSHATDWAYVTATQPYRGRHSAPEPEPWQPAPAQPQDAPAFPLPPAPQPPAAGIAGRPVASAPWAAFNYEPTPEPLDSWPAPPPGSPLWEQPGGFVPLAPPARGGSQLLRTGALVLAVALVGALAWLGYSAFSSDPPAPATAPAAAATDEYTSIAGHFQVKLGADPITSTSTLTQNGFELKTVAAADRVDHELVGSLSVSPAVPEAQQTALMRGFLTGMGHGVSPTDLVAGSYLGHPALSATVALTTGSASVEVVAYSSSRLYYLVAPSGPMLNVLKGNFRPIA